ncbi:hypothetical protein EGW08_006266 [Elysia chlorotica]|uniref:Uncharacterized protein n=1 Tax=Elysia chlorotica TaxID=188477 RepID=A0A433TWN8_ELYCH|nr:hypothetical protein EGW08_006266 [Elysia chlorotica]
MAVVKISGAQDLVGAILGAILCGFCANDGGCASVRPTRFLAARRRDLGLQGEPVWVLGGREVTIATLLAVDNVDDTVAVAADALVDTGAVGSFLSPWTTTRIVCPWSPHRVLRVLSPWFHSNSRLLPFAHAPGGPMCRVETLRERSHYENEDVRRRRRRGTRRYSNYTSVPFGIPTWATRGYFPFSRRLATGGALCRDVSLDLGLDGGSPDVHWLPGSGRAGNSGDTGALETLRSNRL